MNVSKRDEVFLAEMGIAPLWRLRRQPEETRLEETGPDETEPAAAVIEAPGMHAPGVIAPPPRDPAWGEIPRTTAPAPAPWTPPAPAPVEEQGDSLEAIAAMDWEELRSAIVRCKRCGDCGGRKPVYGSGPQAARWFVASGASSVADEAAGTPLAGEAGQLFDNMLAAVGLTRERDVYVTNLVKCRPVSANGGDRAPTSEEAAACRPFVERELALSGAGVVLTLGQIAANGLLGKALQEPLAGTRGAAHALGAVPLVATLHPGELLRRGGDKALAWADLCRARALDAGRD
ncbi:uracil-DNA glycosylase family protein [Massilia sp. CMS3.1]|uniref:uracil-DNA glycosylase n=1 Tax=Massilia sp. CMS3.1 TaxID=3373083 RepID=UPI003EE64073